MNKRVQPKIIFTFCTDWFWLDVAKALNEHSVEITHLVSRPPEVQAAAKIDLPNTIIINQDTVEFPSLLFAQNRNNPVLLDSALIESMASCELEFLNITDRLAFFPISVRARKKIFYHLIRYWLRILTEHKPDYIVFTDTPHVGFDTVLFHLAQVRGIPTLSVAKPHIRDRMLLINEYHQHLPKVPANAFPGKTLTQLRATIGKPLIDDVFAQNTWLKKLDQAYKTALATPVTKKQYARFMRAVRSPGSIFPYVRSLFSPSRYGGFNYNDGQIQLVEKLCSLLHRYENHRLLRYYESRTVPLETITQPYIYYPLHFQPERSTTPEGGVYADQLLVIENLSAGMPEGWLIVIKEHPRQFGKFDFQKHGYRSIDFYNTLRENPRVVFVPIKTAQETLIERAEMTATVTGTGGWESLRAQKAALVFGITWYDACQSCYRVRSARECARAIQTAKKKSPEQVTLELHQFLAYYRERFIIGSNSRLYALDSPKKYSTLVQSMAKNMITEIQKAL